MKPPLETLSDKVQDKSKKTLELYNQQLLQKGPWIEFESCWSVVHEVCTYVLIY